MTAKNTRYRRGGRFVVAKGQRCWLCQGELAAGTIGDRIYAYPVHQTCAKSFRRSKRMHPSNHKEEP